MQIKNYVISSFLASSLALNICRAEDSPDFNKDTLTGDWGGTRTQLHEKGIDIGMVYTADILTTGGGSFNSGSSYLHNIDITFTFDGEKLWGIPGSQASIYFLNNYGGRFDADRVGSVQGVDNIEVGANSTKLYEAWYEHPFFDQKLTVRAGLYDLNSEFYSTDSSGLFLHPAFGIGQEVAQTGLNGPSIFPTTSLGIRLKINPHPNWYAQVAVLDAVPGNLSEPRGTHIHLGGGEGALWVFEAGYHSTGQTAKAEEHAELPGEIAPKPDVVTVALEQSSVEEAGEDGVAKSENDQEPAEGFQEVVLHSEQIKQAAEAPLTEKFAIGYWQYTAKFPDLVDVDAFGNPESRKNRGWYVLAERTVYQEAHDPGQGLTVFARFGFAEDDINQSDYGLQAGFNYKGIIDGRDDDIFGVGVAVAHNGGKFKNFMATSGTPVDNAETTWEASYRIQMKPWLAIQPDVQYIVNPGTDPTRKDAWIAGLRFEVTF